MRPATSMETAIRPVWWIADNIAIQGQAGYNYVDNVRGYSGTNAFGRGGSFGIFTIAPTIKPKGGYFTRPELRLFATYSIWSSSLKGTTTPIGEGGNTSGASPPYNGKPTKVGCLEVSWKSGFKLVFARLTSTVISPPGLRRGEVLF